MTINQTKSLLLYYMILHQLDIIQLSQKVYRSSNNIQMLSSLEQCLNPDTVKH